MNGRLTRYLCIPAALAMTMLAQPAAIAATEAATARPEQQLDEFDVKANHLRQIRQAITEAENRFYARYNDLNTNDDFDVHCTRTAALGTHIARRRCEINFYEQALQEWASATVGGYYAPEPQLVYLERIQDYRKNALQVINRDLQLRKLIRKRDDLDKLYARRQKEIFKDRWIDW
jgi:hypothetical protein